MLKVMIVGCGGIAPAHIEGYLNAGEDIEIAALADSNTARGEELAARYGLKKAAITADYRTMLNICDVVSVCTPPSLHRDIAVNALNAGCHILLEKPMAPSLKECDEILEAAARNDRVLSVVVQSRFISGIRNAVDMVKSGTYGKNLFSQINSVWYRGKNYYDLGWRGRWTVEGGGCTQNHSIHHIDLLLWAKGMPKTLTAFMTNLDHPNSEEEDFSSSILTYADGSVAQITSTLVSHGEPQLLTFQMEKAGIAIPFKAMCSKARSNGFPEEDADMKAQVEADFAARPKLPLENHDGQVKNFLAAILRKEFLNADGQDGRNCIELITGVYKSAITHETVTFPIAATDVFYGSGWREKAPHFHEKEKDVEAFADTTITNFKNKF